MSKKGDNSRKAMHHRLSFVAFPVHDRRCINSNLFGRLLLKEAEIQASLPLGRGLGPESRTWQKGNAWVLVKRRDQHEVRRDGERDPTRNASDASVKSRSHFHDLATFRPGER